jgi:hypothetical protein
MLPATQARQEGTLDAKVFSLEARREFFQPLYLLPHDYTLMASLMLLLSLLGS